MSFELIAGGPLFRVSGDSVLDLSFLCDDMHLVVCSPDTITLWNTSSQSMALAIQAGSPLASNTCMSIYTEASRVVCGRSDGTAGMCLKSNYAILLKSTIFSLASILKSDAGNFDSNYHNSMHEGFCQHIHAAVWCLETQSMDAQLYAHSDAVVPWNAAAVVDSLVVQGWMAELLFGLPTR